MTEDTDGAVDGPFELNDKVLHAVFGVGEVTRVEREVVTVRFEKAGYKSLALPDVLESNLLQRVR